MALVDLLQDDLDTRFPTYTFTATTNGALHTFEALDGATRISMAQNRGSLLDAVKAVRNDMVGSPAIMPLLTPAQISASTGIPDGTYILDASDYSIKCFDGDIAYGADGSWSVEATTTNNTLTTVQTFTLSDTTAYLFTATVVARETDGTNRAAFENKVLAYREGGGATIEGSEAAIFEEWSSNWGISFAVSGNDILVQVDGAAATTIKWKSTLKYDSIS